MQERTFGKTLAMVPVFLFGFLIVAAALRLLHHDDIRLYAEQRSEKLLLMDSLKGSADVAAFGSSHVHYGFDPRAFDAGLRARGATGWGSRTVNLAVQGGSQTEQRAMALAYFRSMRENGARPHLVLLELNAGANFTPDHLVHPRAINVYDADAFRLVAALSRPPLPLKQRVGRLGFAAAAMGMYYANVGMLSNRVFAHEPSEAILHQDADEDRRGLIVDAEENDPKAIAGVAALFAGPTLTPATHPVELAEGNRRLVDDLAAAAREAFGPEGVPRFAYVVAPLVADRAEIATYPESLQTSVGAVPIVDAARVDRYPDLFQAPFWRDPAHLNERGAARLAGIVADDLARRG